MRCQEVTGRLKGGEPGWEDLGVRVGVKASRLDTLHQGLKLPGTSMPQPRGGALTPP